MATSVATPLERHLGTIADVNEMTSTSSVGADAHHPAVRPRPRHRRRGARRAGRDQRRAHRPARDAAQQPDLSQGQPGGRADPDPGADLQDARRRGRSTTSVSNIIQQRLLQVSGVGDVEIGGGSLPAVRVELDPFALNRVRHQPEDVRAAIAASQRQPAQGHGAGRRAPAADLHQRPADRRPRLCAAGHRLAQRRGGAPARRRRRRRRRRETSHNLGLFNGERAIIVLIICQPSANVVETVDAIQALLPELQADLPADVTLHVVVRPHHLDPRLAARGRADPGDRRCCWWCWWSACSCAARGRRWCRRWRPWSPCSAPSA